jgi:hypothetical protein
VAQAARPASCACFGDPRDGPAVVLGHVVIGGPKEVALLTVTGVERSLVGAQLLAPRGAARTGLIFYRPDGVAAVLTGRLDRSACVTQPG